MSWKCTKSSSELRKYGGSFGLATQSLAYLDKLDRTLRSTVLANVDHLFAFTMSGEDARLLHELDGIEEGDITNLDDFACYARLPLGGRRLPIFSLRLDAPPEGDREQAQHLQLRSRQRYARPAEVVDAQIAQSSERHTARPPALSTGVRGNGQRRESSEERVNCHPSDSAQENVSDLATRAGRHKRRGSGKGTARTDEHLLGPLTLPMMYEQGGIEGREERDGH